MNDLEREILSSLANVDMDEMAYLKASLNNLDEPQRQEFLSLYRGKRRDPTIVLICTLLGFFVIAGVQRFLVGQIGMGILYLLTAGLCFIGTIIDLINYKKLTHEYNQQMAMETVSMLKMLNS